jgi:hypothetical protein
MHATMYTISRRAKTTVDVPSCPLPSSASFTTLHRVAPARRSPPCVRPRWATKPSSWTHLQDENFWRTLESSLSAASLSAAHAEPRSPAEQPSFR